MRAGSGAIRGFAPGPAAAIEGGVGEEVVIVGLCGSLDPALRVGEVVVCESVMREGVTTPCDPALTERLAERLRARRGRALTVDRVVTARDERARLYERSGASVVEMEGAYLVPQLVARDCKVTMVRIVSDDARRDLPDIADAIAPDGTLRPLVLARAFARAPLAALRFSLDARRALAVLSSTTAQLISR